MKNAHVTATLDIEKGPRQHYPLQCGIGISRDCSRSFVQMPWGRQEISIMLLKMQKLLFVESLSIEQNASTYRAVASLKNKLHIMEQTIKRFPNSPACALPLITLHKPGGKKCIPVEIESKKRRLNNLTATSEYCILSLSFLHHKTSYMAESRKCAPTG